MSLQSGPEREALRDGGQRPRAHGRGCARRRLDGGISSNRTARWIREVNCATGGRMGPSPRRPARPRSRWGNSVPTHWWGISAWTWSPPTPAAPAFTLGVSPVSQTVVPGSPTSYAVTITDGRLHRPGPTGVTGLPAGATGNFNTNPASRRRWWRLRAVGRPVGRTRSPSAASAYPGAQQSTVRAERRRRAEHSTDPLDLGAQTVNEDTATGPIPFTVGDVEPAAGSLTVSGTSTNTTLVPNGNIVFGGSGANRTVSITPAANQTGTATITVTVSDGTLTTVHPFLLTVTAVNDAPPSRAWVSDGERGHGDGADPLHGGRRGDAGRQSDAEPLFQQRPGAGQQHRLWRQRRRPARSRSRRRPIRRGPQLSS